MGLTFVLVLSQKHWDQLILGVAKSMNVYLLSLKPFDAALLNHMATLCPRYPREFDMGVEVHRFSVSPELVPLLRIKVFVEYFRRGEQFDMQQLEPEVVQHIWHVVPD